MEKTCTNVLKFLKRPLKYMSPLIQQQFYISHGLNRFYACFNLNCLKQNYGNYSEIFLSRKMLWISYWIKTFHHLNHY